MALSIYPWLSDDIVFEAAGCGDMDLSHSGRKVEPSVNKGPFLIHHVGRE